MCTSFVFRGNDTIIAMNFDNNGMKYSIHTKDPNWFVVRVDGGRGLYPSFGVSSKGEFFNNLLVDSNGKGLYKRPSSKVTHTTKLITDIANGVLSFDRLGVYLENTEVVNTPDWSCHCMICDSDSNAWIVEPGRGTIYDCAEGAKFTILTNVSVWDRLYLNTGLSCSRYNAVSSALEGHSELGVKNAFGILESVSQKSEDWRTALSLVYSKKSNRVYYCLEGNYSEVLVHGFDT